jgi:hypothetical protein
LPARVDYFKAYLINTGEPMGIELQGGRGGARAAGGAIELQWFEGSHARPARPLEASSAQEDRRRLTFWGGGVEIRKSRLWSLKSVLDDSLDALRVPAARPGTRHFRAEHVAGKARSGGHRGASQPLPLPGPRG